MNMKKKENNNKLLKTNKFKNLVKNSLKEKLQRAQELLNLQQYMISKINMPIPHKLDKQNLVQLRKESKVIKNLIDNLVIHKLLLDL